MTSFTGSIPDNPNVPASRVVVKARIPHCSKSGTTSFGTSSTLLTAIVDAKEKGATALEAFAFQYPEGESTYERFRVHRTVFPRDFLSDFGFTTLRSSGRVELARLELGGLQLVAEGKRERVLRVVKEALAPAPVPQRP